MGNYPPPPGASDILGVEFSGVVDDIGSSVHNYKKGDEVFGLVGGVSVDAKILILFLLGI